MWGGPPAPSPPSPGASTSLRHSPGEAYSKENIKMGNNCRKQETRHFMSKQITSKDNITSFFWNFSRYPNFFDLKMSIEKKSEYIIYLLFARKKNISEKKMLQKKLEIGRRKKLWVLFWLSNGNKKRLYTTFHNLHLYVIFSSIVTTLQKERLRECISMTLASGFTTEYSCAKQTLHKICGN